MLAAVAVPASVPLWLWVIWALLGLVSLALLVVLLTPWGRSRPLRKCVLISLMVHALLLTYAATVKILSGYRGIPQEDVAIRIVDISTEPEPESPRQPGKPQPWEQMDEPPPQLPADMPRREVPPAVEPGAPERRAAERQGAKKTPVPPAQAAKETSPEEPPPPKELPLAEPVPKQSVSSAPAQATEAPQVSEPKRPAQPPELQTPKEALPGPPPHRARLEPSPAQAAVVQQQPGPVLPELKTSPEAELLQGQLPAGGSELPVPQFDAPGPQAPSAAELVQQRRPERSSPMAPRLIRRRKPAAIAQGGPEPEPSADEPQPLRPLVPVRLERPEQEALAGKASPLDASLALRTAPRRMQRVLEQGGNEKTEQAIQLALAWLAAQQQPDGSWSATAHGGGRDLRTLGQARPKAGTRAETGITGLVLLAFLGAGHTHARGSYKQNVARGLDYLLAQQDRSSGSLSGRATLYAAMYCHGMATLALAESYLMTGDPRLKEPLRRAVGYTLKAQHPYTGGWRYRVGDALGDTSQLGWQLMVLHCGRMARVQDSPLAWQRAGWFLRSVSSGRRGGLAAYQVGHRPSPTMTAEALFCRVLLGAPADDPALQEAADYLMDHLPRQTEPNFYYWYYGTLGLYHLQDEHWRRWNQALVRTLLALQERHGPQRGSWTARSAWGGYGGRAFTTALAVMSLEVYYRYVPAYAQAPGKRAARGPGLLRR